METDRNDVSDDEAAVTAKEPSARLVVSVWPATRTATPEMGSSVVASTTVPVRMVVFAAGGDDGPAGAADCEFPHAARAHRSGTTSHGAARRDRWSTAPARARRHVTD
jgi:hypothetical protein